MSFRPHAMHHAADEAGRHLRSYAGDAADEGSQWLQRGRELGRSGRRHVKRGARHAQVLAADVGERVSDGAWQLKRQAHRHPLLSIGVAAVATVGILVLAQRAWKRRQQAAAEVQSPEHDYFADVD